VMTSRHWSSIAPEASNRTSKEASLSSSIPASGSAGCTCSIAGSSTSRPSTASATTLWELSIQAAPTARFDLEELPHLRRVAGDWALIASTIQTLSALREVSTWRYDEPDLAAFHAHTMLERLTVKDAPRLQSVYGLGGHRPLSHLEIRGAKRLSDFSTLPELHTSLTDLRLEKCAPESLDLIARLTELTFLVIADCGDLPSAMPLQQLPALELLSAWGSTRFTDGDLSAVAALPALRELRMQNRRHYRPQVRELAAAIARRG
jgi:hypothetical protein